MSGFNIPEEARVLVGDGVDLTAISQPYFQGTVPATIIGGNAVVGRDEAGVPTGRVSVCVKAQLTGDTVLQEANPEPGKPIRTAGKGFTFEKWIEFSHDEKATSGQIKFHHTARKELGQACGVLNGSKDLSLDQLQQCLNKPVVLKLGMSQKKDESYRQDIYFKAPGSAK